MTASNAKAPPGRQDDEEERHRLTALEGLAALSLDALSSVAYGPEAILVLLTVLASLVAEDNFLPHLFYLKAERQVHRYGVGVLAVFAAVLLVVSRGNTQALVPLFAIGVFVGFTLSQVGMVRHWSEQRQDGWWWRATIHGAGAVLTFAAIIIPLLVAAFMGIHRTYHQIGQLLGLGTIPPPPRRQEATIVVPVGGLSRLTEEAITAALALGQLTIT